MSAHPNVLFWEVRSGPERASPEHGQKECLGSYARQPATVGIQEGIRPEDCGGILGRRSILPDSIIDVVTVMNMYIKRMEGSQRTFSIFPKSGIGSQVRPAFLARRFRRSERRRSLEPLPASRESRSMICRIGREWDLSNAPPTSG